MNIVCKIFGHITYSQSTLHDHTGWEYMDVKECGTDGIGRRHASIYADCARCHKRFRVGKIHLPREKCVMSYSETTAKAIEEQDVRRSI